MRALIKLSLLLFLLAVLAVPLAAWFALSDRPLVPPQPALSHTDVGRAKAILRAHDPRRLPRGTRQTLTIDAQDLNLATNYLLQRLFRGDARLTLSDDRLRLQATLRVPHLPLKQHLNIDGTIGTAGELPQIERLTLGRLPVPAPLAMALARRALAAALPTEPGTTDEPLISAVEFQPDRLLIAYRWNPGLLDKARDTLLTPADREAMRFYHDRLVALHEEGVGTGGSLTAVLGRLFGAADQRSQDRDPVQENIALLTVLGAWASHQDIGRLVPGRPHRPRRFALRLQGRIDFGQHFLTSAALAARGDQALSDAVGLFKEIVDSDHGSGFSFADIAADRAGTRFGELASRSAGHARALQRRLRDGIDEADIMPPARDLPENLDGATFEARFGHVGSVEYRRVMDEIEQRIGALSLYRD